MGSPSPYAGRRVCLTTLHGKERALARPFLHGLGASLVVAPCDTDQLGTFSGEVERLGDARATCHRKALLGLEASGLSLGLASEASFGPHPVLPLLSVGQELLLFVDLERGLSVLEQRLDLATTLARRSLEPGDLDSESVQAWLTQVRFPSHALMARPADGHPGPCIKAIRSQAELEGALARCAAASPEGRVWLETDMRAHCNPTRMASIRRLGFRLVRRLGRPCPACGAPGWGLQDTLPGLPCSCCGTATALTAQERWGCAACPHTELQPRRDGLQQADPGHCPWCNP